MSKIINAEVAGILAQKGPVKPLLDDLVRQVNDLLAREPY